MARRCVFCGAKGKLSREHVWPGWLSEVLPGSGGFTHTSGFSDEGEQYRFDAEALDQVARFVCIPCNTGWMHDLEEEVRPILTPMIQNQRTTMLQKEQRLVATWAMKTALTVECTFRANRRSISPRVYAAYYRDTTRPVPGVEISLVRYFGNYPNGVSQKSFPLRELVGSADTNWFLSSFRIGYLGIQVFGTGKGNIALRRPGAGRADTMIDLWPPPRRVITWPPRLAMDDEGWEVFSSLDQSALE